LVAVAHTKATEERVLLYLGLKIKMVEKNLQPTKPISKMGGAPVSITLHKLLVATTNVTHLIFIFVADTNEPESQHMEYYIRRTESTGSSYFLKIR